jgi:hypothetical protein
MTQRGRRDITKSASSASMWQQANAGLAFG